MKKTLYIVQIAMCVAMLIAGQVVLSGVSGIEIVTPLLLCFAYCYGVRRGVAIATIFSILRCFIFGFEIQVILLYLIYYNLFAIFFGLLGRKFSHKASLKNTVIVVISAVIFTIFFTLLDDIITPLVFGFNQKATIAYFYTSLYTIIPHTICSAITVSVLFNPLVMVITKTNIKK